MLTSKVFTILIIDDEVSINDSLGDFLQKLGHHVCYCENPVNAFHCIIEYNPDAILLDIKMPKINGLNLLGEIVIHHKNIPVIMITGHGTMESAISAMRLGAIDFLKKPIQLNELEIAINRCRNIMEYHNEINKNKSSVNRKMDNNCERGIFIGTSKKSLILVNEIKMAAQSGCDTLLLTGETGTGKEVAANLYYKYRCHGKGNFITVNCPALPDTLVESELFGYAKGAFTGADRNRAGAFELAENGVLFLDEISELSHSAQSKLLRVLENRTIIPIGRNQEKRINFSVVAASNIPLEDTFVNNSFRQDLYYRLNILQINIPPLREHVEDIYDLASYFIKNYAERIGGTSKQLSGQSIEKLLKYQYPGNIRELKNIIERACVITQGNEILSEHIILSGNFRNKETAQSVNIPEIKRMNSEVEEILHVLNVTGWNMRKTARFLDISYDAVRWRIKKYKFRDPDLRQKINTLHATSANLHIAHFNNIKITQILQ